jgi:hypothetical protein
MIQKVRELIFIKNKPKWNWAYNMIGIVKIKSTKNLRILIHIKKQYNKLIQITMRIY